MSGVQLEIQWDTSTSYVADFHARTSAPPERAPASPESAPASGTSICASCGSSSPAPSSSKTSHRARRAGSFQCAECLRLAAIERAPLAYLQAMSARLNCDDESLCLRWPTPTVSGNYNRKGASLESGDGLETAVKRWPTPKAQDANSCGAQPNLTEAVRMWPTPCARDHKGITSPHRHLQTLPDAVLWPTPTASTYGSNQGGANGRTGKVRLSLEALNKSDGQVLNPNWVECLMGFPAGWTRTGGPPDKENSNTTTSRRAPSRKARTRTDGHG